MLCLISAISRSLLLLLYFYFYFYFSFFFFLFLFLTLTEYLRTHRDFQYYHNMRMETEFAVDDDVIKQYFPIEKGAFVIRQKFCYFSVYSKFLVLFFYILIGYLGYNFCMAKKKLLNVFLFISVIYYFSRFAFNVYWCKLFVLLQLYGTYINSNILICMM